MHGLFGVIGAEKNAFSIFDVKNATLETIGAAGGPSSLYRKTGLTSPARQRGRRPVGNGKLVIRAVAAFSTMGRHRTSSRQPGIQHQRRAAGPAFNGIGLRLGDPTLLRRTDFRDYTRAAYSLLTRS